MAGITIDFEAIGTVWKIEVFNSVPDKAAARLRQSVLTRIDEYDKNYSRFRDDSLVTSMSREAGRYTLPDDAQPLLDLYKQLYDISDGAVTPLIGQTLVEAGYDASYSLKPGKMNTPPKWEDILDYKFPHFTLKQPALLDFGAAGKGYLVDIIGGILHEHGANSYLINAGGDILYQTTNSERLNIGLEHPADSSMAIGVAHISNQSLCGSAGNRRAWGKYHHIIDPKSLDSPRHIAAAWIVADTALLADGLATAIFFVHPEDLQSHFNFEYAIIRSDMSLEHSEKFPADFFVSTQSEKIS
jgi:thiamine biosynthesis lipoprotein